MPRLQINAKLRVRQYIISDPPNIFYTEYYTALKETSSADWQQQMKIPHNFSTALDPLSNSPQNDTTTIRLIPLVDDYNPYYPDPDYGFDPYWEANVYNQHHLYFYQTFNNQNSNIELDSLATDQALNTVLINARVDPWQHGPQLTHQTSHLDVGHKSQHVGTQVSLSTAVAGAL